MNCKKNASKRSKRVKKNTNRNRANRSQKKRSGAPWGNMSFEAILNSETPENHLKKKEKVYSNLKKKNKTSKRNSTHARKTIPK